MTKEEVSKVVWDIIGEFEQVKGQIASTQLDAELKLKKEEFILIAGTIQKLAEQSRDRDTQLLGALEELAKALKTVTERTVQRLDEIEKLIISKLDKGESNVH